MHWLCKTLIYKALEKKVVYIILSKDDVYRHMLLAINKSRNGPSFLIDVFIGNHSTKNAVESRVFLKDLNKEFATVNEEYF